MAFKIISDKVALNFPSKDITGWKDFNIELLKGEIYTYYCYFSTTGRQAISYRDRQTINFCRKKTDNISFPSPDFIMPKPKGKVIFSMAAGILITKGFKEMLKKDSDFFQKIATDMEWLIAFAVHSKMFLYPEKFDNKKNKMLRDFWKELTKDETLKPFIVALKI